MQSNLITMNGTKNGYGVSTLFVNNSVTGTARTTCEYSYYGPNPNKTNILPGLPAMTEYFYTTVIPFDASFNMSNADAYGLDILASEVATYLHLTVANCTYYGGGTGTLKVGVTALTSVQTVYTQLLATTTSSSLAPSTSVATQATPVQSPIVPPPTSLSTSKAISTSPSSPTNTQNTVSPIATTESSSSEAPNSVIKSSGTPSVSPITLNPGTTSNLAGQTTIVGLSSTYVATIIYTTLAPLGSEITGSISIIGSESYTTIHVHTTSGTLGLQTASTLATIGSGSYVTMITEITIGPSGLETISEISTLLSDSHVSTIIGITSSTTALSSGPTASLILNSTSSVPYTANAYKTGPRIWSLVFSLPLLSLAVMFVL